MQYKVLEQEGFRFDLRRNRKSSYALEGVVRDQRVSGLPCLSLVLLKALAWRAWPQAWKPQVTQEILSGGC